MFFKFLIPVGRVEMNLLNFLSYGIDILGFLITFWILEIVSISMSFEKSLNFLVISTPCRMGISQHTFFDIIWDGDQNCAKF